MKKKKIVSVTSVFLALMILTSGIAFACGDGNCEECSVAAEEMDISAVEKNVRMALPAKAGKVTRVKETPLPGIFEVLTDGDQILYMDGAGSYLLLGQLIDLKTKMNLTEAAKPQREVDFASLPLENAIKYGSGKRKIVTFEDPDCGYCRKLHPELKTLIKNEDVEVYTFLFPLRSKAKSESIWCSDDPAGSLDAAFEGRPVQTKSCDNPLDENIELGRRLGIRGTPMIILDNGKQIPGYTQADAIKGSLGI